MKATLNNFDLSPLEVNALQVAVDHEIESQNEYFGDIVDSPNDFDRADIPHVKERLVALHLLKTKLAHIAEGN